jgi:hypothetical protein
VRDLPNLEWASCQLFSSDDDTEAYWRLEEEAKSLMARHDLPAQQNQCALDLLSCNDGIILDQDQSRIEYINGIHRAHAMLSAGVRRTLILWVTVAQVS